MSRLAVLLLALAACLLMIEGAGAQAAVDFSVSSATGDFPNGISFHLEATAGAAPQDVRVVYEIAPDGVRASAVADCTGGTSIICNFELASTPSNLIIPGAEVTYFWRVTGSDGVAHESDPQLITYVDSRFDWKTVTDGKITVSYYSGSEDDARAVLNAARESLDKNSERLQTTVDFPVKVFFYDSARDMGPALLVDNAEGVVTLGEVVYSDTAMVAAGAVPVDIARHEVAHIVVRQAVKPPYDVPAWLNEGLAVYSQSQPLSDQRRGVENAIADNSVLSVRQMSSASSGAQSSKVSLFYGESWSLVKFLIETYGEQKFSDLFHALGDGSNTGSALQAVYGFGEDGLENNWRESVGLPPRAVPTQAEAVPTAQRVPTEPVASHDKKSTSVGLIIAVVAMTVVLAGGLGVGGVLVARRYR